MPTPSTPVSETAACCLDFLALLPLLLPFAVGVSRRVELAVVVVVLVVVARADEARVLAEEEDAADQVCPPPPERSVPADCARVRAAADADEPAIEPSCERASRSTCFFLPVRSLLLLSFECFFAVRPAVVVVELPMTPERPLSDLRAPEVVVEVDPPWCPW